MRLVALLASCAFAIGCGPGMGGPDGGGSDDDGIDGGTGDRADAFVGGPDAAACTATSKMADEALAPVDIIWVVDSSGSMNDETTAVQNALNDFSTFIAGTGIDYRVILIGSASDMTVPPPLGGGPRFLHVNQGVGSSNSLALILSNYSEYQSFLRPGAAVHFVEVTDDETSMSRTAFDAALGGLSNPGFPNGYTFHAICSEETVVFTPPPPFPPIMGPCSGGLGLGGAAAPGLIYIDMVAATGGVWRSICTTDWTPIFTAVAEAVSVGVALPCTYDIPPPPEGESLDPNRVNVVFTPNGGNPVTVPRVDDAGSCGAGQGWYYDNPAAPTQIMVCPATCDDFGDADMGVVDIEFGCATIVD